MQTPSVAYSFSPRDLIIFEIFSSAITLSALDFFVPVRLPEACDAGDLFLCCGAGSNGVESGGGGVHSSDGSGGSGGTRARANCDRRRER